MTNLADISVGIPVIVVSHTGERSVTKVTQVFSLIGNFVQTTGGLEFDASTGKARKHYENAAFILACDEGLEAEVTLEEERRQTAKRAAQEELWRVEGELAEAKLKAAMAWFATLTEQEKGYVESIVESKSGIVPVIEEE